MVPEELNLFALQHTSEISRTTVALFKHVSGEADQFASGVLVQVEGKRFLVTAAHVSDEFFCERWKQIFLGRPSGDDLIPVIGAGPRHLNRRNRRPRQRRSRMIVRDSGSPAISMG